MRDLLLLIIRRLCIIVACIFTITASLAILIEQAYAESAVVFRVVRYLLALYLVLRFISVGHSTDENYY